MDDGGKIGNELSIVVQEAKERAKFLEVARLWCSNNCFNLAWQCMETFCINLVAQILHSWLKELALIPFHAESVLL